MAPTYLCRFPGSHSDGFCGSALRPSFLMSDSSSQKADLRAAALAKRDALSADERAAAAETIAARGLAEAKPGLIVSGFMPLKSEINPLPLMRRLLQAGATL